MARIPYPAHDNPQLATLVEKIRSERGGRLLNLYRMLLHSPPVAEGWLALLTAIRQKCGLPARLRELAILHIAVLNGADYEFRTHVPFALQEGVTHGQILALQAHKFDAFSEREAAVLVYAESMTRCVRVPDQVFHDAARHLDEREMVELAATVAAYNMVSRFLEALQVDHD